MGMVIQLSRDLHLACEDNTELREALERQKVRYSAFAAVHLGASQLCSWCHARSAHKVPVC